jgi:aminodeoxyfutalosine deaminase
MRVLSGRWVIPIGQPPIADGAIALDDRDVVRLVGTRAEVRAKVRAEFGAAREERAEGALVPGLVNAHCHLELSALEGAIDGGEGLIPWVRALSPLAAALPPALRRTAARAAARGAAHLGTAAIGDVGNTLEGAAAIGEAGIGGVLFHELLGSREAATGDALADAAREREAAADHWPGAVAYVPAPHAPYSAGPELLRRIFSAAAATGRSTSIHVAEDPDEVALLADGTGRWPEFLTGIGVDPASRSPGRSPLAYLSELGAFDGSAPPVLVHMVHASDGDRRIARAARATVALCPRSNLHIGGRLANVPALIEDGIPLAIGTDSLASAPDLSLWGEMATLAAHFPAVPSARWLEAATAGGAHAIGMSALGSFAPDKRPGVLDVLIEDLTAPLESLVRDPTPSLRWMARA